MAARFDALLSGLLLMTIAGSPIDASENSGKLERLLADFTATGADLGWYVVNDSVMGGRSEGGFSREHEALHFAGRTNTNGGGFSSIRTAPLQLDLSKYTGIRLHVNGDGRRYTWRLTTDATVQGRQVGYWADFETRDGEWTTASIPFAAFTPRIRGYQLDGPTLDPARITGMGLMIYDQADGAFEIRLASVHAYAKEDPFELASYRWQQRVLVLSAANDNDEDLKRQLREVTRSAQDFADRDLALVTLLDNPGASADSRQLTAAEVAAARAALGIPGGNFALRLLGKDGSVKLARDSAVAMADIYALIDTMPMRRVEVARTE